MQILLIQYSICGVILFKYGTFLHCVNWLVILTTVLYIIYIFLSILIAQIESNKINQPKSSQKLNILYLSFVQNNSLSNY